MIYLDNAATTFPKPEEVYQAMDYANRNKCVNAGRGSYALAREASGLITETKIRLRKLIKADANAAVVFSPSITIALNQILNGIKYSENASVYVSPYEHNAVARTVSQIAKSRNLKICMLPINRETMEIDSDKMKYEFSKAAPFAVICTHVSNVTGYILPVSSIFAEAKKYNAITILDAAQSMGLIDIDVRSLGVDIVAFAGHKCLYGPLGIGGFINVTGVELGVFVTGGTGSDSLNLNMPEGAETRFEAASSNIVAIAGLHSALGLINVRERFKHEKELTEYLINKLSDIKDVKLLLPSDLSKHVGIVSFVVEDIASEDVGIILDEDFGIAVRTGYHCAPWIHEFLNDKSSLGTVRVGIGMFTTKDDIDCLVNALSDIN